MSWIDNFLNSSTIVWIIIGIGILHIYLKKTGKTLLEVIKEVREFFNSLSE